MALTRTDSTSLEASFVLLAWRSSCMRLGVSNGEPDPHVLNSGLGRKTFCMISRRACLAFEGLLFLHRIESGFQALCHLPR